MKLLLLFMLVLVTIIKDSCAIKCYQCYGLDNTCTVGLLGNKTECPPTTTSCYKSWTGMSHKILMTSDDDHRVLISDSFFQWKLHRWPRGNVATKECTNKSVTMWVEKNWHSLIQQKIRLKAKYFMTRNIFKKFNPNERFWIESKALKDFSILF